MWAALVSPEPSPHPAGGLPSPGVPLCHPLCVHIRGVSPKDTSHVGFGSLPS